MSARPKRCIEIFGHRMAYVDVGSGSPIVFLHGNPTSSFIWRNVLPHVERLGRCIAPDLIGMGDSDKLERSGPGSYRFLEHRAYLESLLENLEVGRDVTFVVHDWGSALGFDWARRHPGAVRGIAYMEAIVMPLTWDAWPKARRELFEQLRGREGETLALEQNVFIDQLLPTGMLRRLTAAEHEEYRRPYREPGEARRPTLAWPRELPIDGQPRDVVAIVKAYGAWLSTCHVPKLFVSVEPGGTLTGDRREYCRRWPNQREVVVAGRHFVQEDSPDAIGEALATWYREIGRDDETVHQGRKE
jgi:haloalkane dehalogenase